MKEILVGSTGFVGSNIAGSHTFDGLYHSTDIADAYGSLPDLCVFAGLRAEKFLANQDPQADYRCIETAFETIRKIDPKRLVLISTVDVLKAPNRMTEEDEVDETDLQAYGYNRYQLEKMVREAYPDALIVRLPGLYGKNIKKNFIYDFINRIPSMLKEEKYASLRANVLFPADCYEKGANGFYKVKALSPEKRAELREFFVNNDFSALNFTDSRGVYQYYPLRMLWSHIEKALSLDIRLLHAATEPVCTDELYEYLTGETFVNEVAANPVYYDFRSCRSEAFGGKDGYLLTKEFVMEDIREFVFGEIH